MVLVEPAGALNVGSVARLCENFGVKELRLVSPRCDPNDPEAKLMAVGGRDLLTQAKLFPSLLDAISDCSRVVATCGRIDHGEIALQTPEKALKWLLETSGPGPIGIIFGREDRGLSNEELQFAQKVISIETHTKYPSLNLSHAVGIILHQLQRYKFPTSNDRLDPAQTPNPASAIQLNDFLNDAKDLLLEIGFLLEHTSNSRMRKVKDLLQRAEIRSNEVSLLRGMVRQIRWAINSKEL